MKYAVKVTETLTNTVIVEADNYLEAEEKVRWEYDSFRLILNADNSAVDVEFENDTDNYGELFGEEDFQSMEETL